MKAYRNDLLILQDYRWNLIAMNIETERQKNLDVARIEIEFLKEEFSKIDNGLSTTAFNKIVKDNDKVSHVADKYFKTFYVSTYSRLFLKIKEYDLISCGHPSCVNVASPIIPHCSRVCGLSNPTNVIKNREIRFVASKTKLSWQSDAYAPLNTGTIVADNDRDRSLIVARHELAYINTEFAKIDSSLSAIAFNRLVKNNLTLSRYASKYLKTFAAGNYSTLVKRIEEYYLIPCGNPNCLNVASSIKPNCSVSCSLKNPESLEKFRLTCLEKYGVENPRKSESVKNKSKAVFLKKYGVENPSQNAEVRAKMKATCMEKYGVEVSSQAKSAKDKALVTCLERYGGQSPSQNRVVREKIKKTWLEKHGVAHPLQSAIVKNKSKATCLKKYGVDHPWKSEEIKDNIKATCLKKYGVEHWLQNSLIRDKIKATCLEKYGAEYIGAVTEVIDKMWKTKVLKKWDLIASNPLIRLLTTKEEFGVNSLLTIECSSCSTPLEYPELRCFICYPLRTNFEQNAVRDYITSLGFDVVEKDRIVIKPQEIDILIPSKKIGIEYNGVYWHSEKMRTAANYHRDKTESARQAGYRLIHLFSDQWLYKQEIIKKRLRHILGLETRTVYSRKCAIEEISSRESREFLNDNHIQGNSNAKIRLALKYEDEIVAVMTFSKPRFNKNYDYEMIRFATSCNVPGAASKLLAAFRRMVPLVSIITYADKSWSNGDLYRQLGFTELKDSAPSYFWTNGRTSYKRYETMKHKLAGILKDFDENATENENMMRNGFYKVHDCGNKVFELKY